MNSSFHELSFPIRAGFMWKHSSGSWQEKSLLQVPASSMHSLSGSLESELCSLNQLQDTSSASDWQHEEGVRRTRTFWAGCESWRSSAEPKLTARMPGAGILKQELMHRLLRSGSLLPEGSQEFDVKAEIFSSGLGIQNPPELAHRSLCRDHLSTRLPKPPKPVWISALAGCCMKGTGG